MQRKNGCYVSVSIGFLVFAMWVFLRSIELANKFLRSKAIWNWLVAVNLITLIMNAADKLLAVYACKCRIPEVVLHLLSLAGGASATALSMIVLNHKSSKVRYQKNFLGCCVAHVCIVLLTVIIKD